MNLLELSVTKMHEKLKRRDISVTDIARECLDRINKTNNNLNSLAFVREDTVLREAAELDRLGMPEDASVLWGIPVSLKENISLKNSPLSCGSKILENYEAPYDSTVVQKLKKNKALIVGSARMDEFAMGSSTENNAFARVKNPHDISRVPGGSSGGSAAAVASHQVPLALGSDTGGSIRQPASFCGTVGFKPTYGTVSRFGLVAFASSLDQIGPLSRCVEDAAYLFESISGHDVHDSTSYQQGNYEVIKTLQSDIKGMKVGIPKEYFGPGMSKSVREVMEQAIKHYQNLGAEMVEVSLPHTDYAIATYYILATAEASSNLERYDGVRYGYRSVDCPELASMYFNTRSEGFGREVKRRILLGTYVLSSGYYDAYYLKAQKVRTLISQDFSDAFKLADVILTPTSPDTAFKFGEKSKDPVSMYLSDIYTVSVNLAGLPAISIPGGFDSQKLPIGVQLIAPALGEKTLLNAAYKLESLLDYQVPFLNV